MFVRNYSIISGKNELYLLAKIRLWAVFISSNRLCKITFYSSIRNNCHHITIFK